MLVRNVRPAYGFAVRVLLVIRRWSGQVEKEIWCVFVWTRFKRRSIGQGCSDRIQECGWLGTVGLALSIMRSYAVEAAVDHVVARCTLRSSLSCVP